MIENSLGLPGFTQLSLFTVQERFEIKEEIVLYNFNNFIGEVGGHLGLLLGCSILSLYDSVYDYFGKRIGKSVRYK